MEFKNQDEAFEYWREEVYYGSGEGYVGLGRNFEDQVDMFKDWLEYEAIGWPDTVGIQNLQD